MSAIMTLNLGANDAQATLVSPDKKRRVLVTGAAGWIGAFIAEYARDKYDLRLMVRDTDKDVDRIRPCGEVVVCDLGDLKRLKEICAGVDTVIHMAGNPNASATWDQLLEANIIGTYNLFAAAKYAECRRVIYASSIHAVSGYPNDVQVKTSEPANPGDLYGVTKCFGESLGRYMAEQEGVSTIAIRIGAFDTVKFARRPHTVGVLDSFISDRDMMQLIERSIEVENVRFAILHGLSDNTFKRLDISDTCALTGYRPEDDFNRENPLLRELKLGQARESHSLRDPDQRSGLRRDLKPE